MKFSTKTRYALRFMLYLAINYSAKSNIKLNEVATKENISMKYLEQIVMTLKTSGFLNVSRGANGGYSLAKPPVSINLMEIIKAINGEINIIDELEEDTSKQLNLTIIKEVWNPLNKLINKFFFDKNLSDLVESFNSQKQGMYYV